ncbi:Legumain [Fasciola gigantica]|uniref:Legumain n=1 Tax=Fasciola gigantica TaxID=46835 RepID=A0A504YW24_FASGI|nr:Legumain [Fasciola gigantica]
MQGYLVILSFLGSFALGLEDNARKHWAVLVAGSDGWSNYRHQADVCHACQLLKKNGISTDHIITMMYDDIANNKKNPFPGKIFNEYEHQDVYAGVKIDYRGEVILLHVPQHSIAVFTMTASNPTESSWAALCADPEIDTCLGDEFTHQWMTDTEKLSKFVKDSVDEVVEEVISQAEPNGKSSAVHKRLECFREVYEQYKHKCFSIQQVPELSDELDKFDQLCEQGYDANVMVQAIFATCD